MVATSLAKHYRITGLADRLGVGRTLIKEALAKRELPFRRLGEGKRAPVLISEADALVWLEKRTRFFAAADDVAQAVR